MRCNFGSVIFEWKPLDFIGTQSPRVEANILVPCLFRWMLFGIAPSKLHWRPGADGRVRDIVGDDPSRDLVAVDENLHARRSARAVVSEKDVLPGAVERERSDRDDTDRNLRRRVLGRFCR